MNEDYIKTVNKIVTYIEGNLDADFSLETIAKMTFYSPFHLHRIFKAVSNETLNAYIIRKRIERAAIQLIHKREMTIAQIALHNGFNSNTSFTRSFRKLYGKSPTDFRKTYADKHSKISKTDSKNGKVNFITDEYICNINNHKNWINMNAKIEVKEMPKIELAYITQIGVMGLENAFERLIKWARPKGLLKSNEQNIVRIFHDSFKFTEEEKVRMSIGVILKNKILTDNKVGLTIIEKGTCVVGHFEIEHKDFEISWSSLFIWMNEQGYKKSDKNPYEMYYNDFNDHPEKKSIVDFCIPIE
ncbi:MAG: helix-turn-helix domain-containing protein [Bacteroidia bacterium]